MSDIVARVLSSDGKTKYTIRDNGAGELLCECKGFGHRMKCRHIPMVHGARKGLPVEGVELVQPQYPAEVIDWATGQRFANGEHEALLQFDLVVGGQRVAGRPVTYHELKVDDVVALAETADRLSRLLGVAARIVTSGEEPEDIPDAL